MDIKYLENNLIDIQNIITIIFVINQSKIIGFSEVKIETRKPYLWNGFKKVDRPITEEKHQKNNNTVEAA
jgi:hypothetical protein